MAHKKDAIFELQICTYSGNVYIRRDRGRRGQKLIISSHRACDCIAHILTRRNVVSFN